MFERAARGVQLMGSYDKTSLTVIDFTKPSTEKRLFVIDLKLKKILFISYVAHGRNSGEICHLIFQPEGSFRVRWVLQNGKHVYGKNGYSLMLDGLERGINDAAKERAIVMHRGGIRRPVNHPVMWAVGRSWDVRHYH